VCASVISTQDHTGCRNVEIVVLEHVVLNFRHILLAGRRSDPTFTGKVARRLFVAIEH
jgi:hypothetical protein